MSSNNMDKHTLEEFLEHFGKDQIPNPNQYPLQFEFLVKSFMHYKKMKEIKNSVVEK